MCVGNGGVAEHVAYFDARIAKSFSGSASVHRNLDWHFFPSSSSWCSWGFISASAAW
jgi:hypothetical protein